jgi:LmbE family N-acetylglucosaminyl deacetylase
MLCPHPDDGAITAACLLHEFAVHRGLPVIEVLVFAGERNVDAPWLDSHKKAVFRENEFRQECDVLGTEAVLWDLDAYRSPGYQPTAGDIDTIVSWFTQRRPGALIVPAGHRRPPGPPHDPRLRRGRAWSGPSSPTPWS